MKYEPGLGAYMRDIALGKPLSLEEEASLATRIQEGDRKALNRLVVSNLRFVINVASAYAHQGVPIQDLVAMGNMGLIKAAQRFDGSKNFKFISYAVWWVRQAILHGLAEQSRITRVPVNKAGDLHTLGKAVARAESKYGRIPSTEDIATESSMSLSNVETLLGMSAPILRLDAPANEDGIPFVEMMAGDSSTDESAENRSLSEAVGKILDRLNTRERRVIEMYYGLGEWVAPMMLDEIGGALGVSRERVRQVRNKALSKVRASVPRHRTIRDYVSG